MARQRPRGGRQVNRGDRLGELFRQIIAEELERLDRDELRLVSVTNVEVDGNLSKAIVAVSNLEPEDDEQVLATLAEVRVRLQKAVGDQSRVRRVPPFQFVIDNVLRSSQRIDEILRGIDEPEDPEDPEAAEHEQANQDNEEEE